MENNAISVRNQVLDLVGKSSSDMTHFAHEFGNGDMAKGFVNLFDKGIEFGLELARKSMELAKRSNETEVKKAYFKGTVRTSLLWAGGIAAYAIIQSAKKKKAESEHLNIKTEEKPDAMNAEEQQEAADSQNATESVSDESDALSNQDEASSPEENA